VTEQVRVLIVDDHSVVREGIRHVLAGDPRLTVVGEAGDASAAVAQAELMRPDVVLLDITMPGTSGLDAVPRLLAVSPRSRILMLSVHDHTEYVLQAVRAGAHGYLRKDTTPAELRQAVHAVHKGDAFFSPTAARHLTQALRGESAGEAPPAAAGGQPGSAEARRAVEALTGREREVLLFIARGALNKEIAATLGISVRTVEAHRDNLMRKLGIRTVAGLTKLVLESGLDRHAP
jgi:DNA-binding NarL/FixJ family response regulator